MDVPSPSRFFPHDAGFCACIGVAIRVMVTAPTERPRDQRGHDRQGSGLASTFPLRFATACKGCGRALAVGSSAYRGMKAQGVRCALCGPFPLPEATSVTQLPPGRADGAYGHQDGLRPMMTKKAAAGIAKSRGGAGKSDPQPLAPLKRRRRGRPPV